MVDLCLLLVRNLIISLKAHEAMVAACSMSVTVIFTSFIVATSSFIVCSLLNHVLQLFDGHNGSAAAIYSKENLLNNVLGAIPSDLNRDEWVAALPRALVAGFVKTDKDFQEKGSGTFYSNGCMFFIHRCACYLHLNKSILRVHLSSTWL
jgi:hypothetical protein